MKAARTAIATALTTLAATAFAAPLSFTQLWTYDHALTGVAGQKSEIVSYDALTNSLWVGGVVGIDDDGRSDNKGVEPEGVALGEIGGPSSDSNARRRWQWRCTTSPIQPMPASSTSLSATWTVRPRATFVSGGMLYLAVSSEVSDTTSVFNISAVPEPSAWALMAGGLALIGWRSRSRRRQA